MADDVWQRVVNGLGGVDELVGLQDLFWLSCYVFLTAGVFGRDPGLRASVRVAERSGCGQVTDQRVARFGSELAAK